MIQVAFYDWAEEAVYEFAVIAAKKDGKWLLCRHGERDTWECPGGHREAGERIEDTAKRELFEETGAEVYTLQSVSAYSCMRNGGEASFGMLYFAQIESLGSLPKYEIAEVKCFDMLSKERGFWTYPDIQPYLIRKVEDFMRAGFEKEVVQKEV